MEHLYPWLLDDTIEGGRGWQRESCKEDIGEPNAGMSFKAFLSCDNYDETHIEKKHYWGSPTVVYRFCKGAVPGQYDWTAAGAVGGDEPGGDVHDYDELSQSARYTSEMELQYLRVWPRYCRLGQA